MSRSSLFPCRFVFPHSAKLSDVEVHIPPDKNRFSFAPKFTSTINKYHTSLFWYCISPIFLSSGRLPSYYLHFIHLLLYFSSLFLNISPCCFFLSIVECVGLREEKLWETDGVFYFYALSAHQQKTLFLFRSILKTTCLLPSFLPVH